MTGSVGVVYSSTTVDGYDVGEGGGGDGLESVVIFVAGNGTELFSYCSYCHRTARVSSNRGFLCLSAPVSSTRRPVCLSCGMLCDPMTTLLFVLGANVRFRFGMVVSMSCKI